MLRFEMHTRFWLIVLAVFVFLLWLLKPVLLPFLAGMAIAYFLNPVVNVLSRHKVPRWLGALAVLFSFVLVVAALFVLIVPLLQSQIGALLNSVPGYIEKFRTHFLPWFENWLARFSPEDVDKLRDAASQSASEAAGWVGKVLQQIISGGFALIDIVALMIVTPVVAFFMLRDWGKLTQAIDSLIPLRYYDTIQEQLRQVDATLSGFVRGQALVCLALGSIYSVGLTLTGLQYGATIGIIAGVLSFIPYVGTTFGWITSLMLALVQFDGDWLHICMVAAVFFVGHFLEAYVLTPKLVGQRVGLHPVWILFALITGVKLMGFTGVLIAVPTAAVVGVLTRFALKQYRESPFYRASRTPSHS